MIIIFSLLFGSCDSSGVHYISSENESDLITTKVEPFENYSPFDYTPSSDSMQNVINCSSNSTYMACINPYLYFYNSNVIVRYNPEANSITYLCSDPLCLHNSPDCPFYGLDVLYGFYIYENTIYYRQQYDYQKNGKITDSVNRISAYSINTGELAVLRNLDDSPLSTSNMIFYDHFYLYTDIIFNNETHKSTYNLCRQDLNTKNIEIVLSEESWNTVPLFTYNNVLYIRNSEKKELYSANADTPLEMKKISDDTGKIAFCKDGYFIFKDQQGSLFRMNADSSNIQSLNIKNVDYFYLTDNYIYYTQVDQKLKGKTEDGQDINIDLYSISRIDHDGNNNELVWKNNNSSELLLPKNFVVYGNYIYTVFDYFKVDDFITGISSRSNDFIYARINCDTQDIFYITISVK